MTTSPDLDLDAPLRSTHEASGHTVDFGRKLCLVLGLPFDVIDLDTAVARIRAAVASRTRLFISTPNTNFVVAAMRDPAFRDSVFHSDLSLMDGTPLVWVARSMGIAIPQRVSGSDIFEALRLSGSPPISVYFFGGQPGSAPAASAKINAAHGPMRCVGFDEAGFGSVEQMSDQATIERINASGADFLVVSLGAAKGQAWIEHNLSRIEVPVVSHLGAVVNFVAGSVNRAPVWIRGVGLEWLWRVKEEPHLWRRYFYDGVKFVSLLTTRIAPLVFRRVLQARGASRAQWTHQVSSSSCGVTLSLFSSRQGTLNRPCASLASVNQPLAVNLKHVADLDNSCVATLMQLSSHRDRCGLPIEFRGASSSIRNSFRLTCTEHVIREAGDSVRLTLPAVPP